MNQIVRKARLNLAVIVALMAVAVFASCEKYTFTPPAVDPDYDWKLSEDIQPIFTASCASCHAGTLAPDLRTGKSFNSLTKGGFVTLPGETSSLYLKLNASSHVAKTTVSEKLKILYWIDKGPKNN